MSMYDVSDIVFTYLTRAPRVITQTSAAYSVLFVELENAKQSLRKLNLEFYNCKPRFAAGPLDSEMYFTYDYAVRIQTQLTTAALAIMVRAKNAVPELKQAESLEQSLVWDHITLVHSFAKAATDIIVAQCREFVKEVDSAVPKRRIESRQETKLDDYWEYYNEELKTNSAFYKQVEYHKNVQNIRQTMLEVKTVYDVFMQNLESYGKQILRIQDINLSSEANLTQANTFIARAKKNLGDSTKVTIVLFIIAISGLWWIDRARGG